MKTNSAILLGLALIFSLFNYSANAQILQSRAEILKTYGTPFSTGVTKSGENYIYYKIPVTTKASGNYDQGRVLFFKPSDDGSGEEICYKFKILEPATETKYNFFSFSKDLVQTGDMQWKDFGKGIVYDLSEKNGICRIVAWYDSEVNIVRVYKM